MIDRIRSVASAASQMLTFVTAAMCPKLNIQAYCLRSFGCPELIANRCLAFVTGPRGSCCGLWSNIAR